MSKRVSSGPLILVIKESSRKKMGGPGLVPCKLVNRVSGTSTDVCCGTRVCPFLQFTGCRALGPAGMAGSGPVVERQP